MAPRRVALYGGTFDPFHQGHLAVARAAIASGLVDDVRLIPGGTPPHRSPTRATANERWLMAVLATLGETGLQVERWETDRIGRTYAVDTMQVALQALGTDTDLYWVIGTDAMAEIASWKAVEDLFAGMRFLVVARDGLDVATVRQQVANTLPWLQDPQDRIIELPMTSVGISSTAVRAALETGAGTETLLPPAVAAYIRQYRLYRA